VGVKKWQVFTETTPDQRRDLEADPEADQSAGPVVAGGDTGRFRKAATNLSAQVARMKKQLTRRSCSW